jgi:hypothetical protein
LLSSPILRPLLGLLLKWIPDLIRILCADTRLGATILRFRLDEVT